MNAVLAAALPEFLGGLAAGLTLAASTGAYQALRAWFKR